MVLSVGLDWAVDPVNCAAVILEKNPAQPMRIVDVVCKVEDGDVKRLCAVGSCDVVAVDIPFSWPKEFASFVASWSPLGPSPRRPPESIAFRYRTTDRFVYEKTRKWPLSISSNLFALGARRWSKLVHEFSLHAQIAVSTNSLSPVRPLIIEVYPAATLKALEGQSDLLISGQSRRADKSEERSKQRDYSYKTDFQTRQALVGALFRSFRIDANDSMQNDIVSTGNRDHATDALLSALTGLMFLGSFQEWDVAIPSDEQVDDARSEGWIFFPRPAHQGIATSRA